MARLDHAHDLAVLISDVPLAATAGELAATDKMAPRTKVTVTGQCVIADPGRTARSLTTIGQWTGSATWEDATPAGRMTAEALLPGMSGAPVIRDSDGAVAGVVSGRYNSTDGWLEGTVWVTRTEDLAVLLDGIAAVTMKQSPLAGPVDLLSTVGRTCLPAHPGPPGQHAAGLADGPGAAAPRQLPPAVRHFAGREAELAALAGQLADAAGTVVISAVGGTAGIGKTIPEARCTSSEVTVPLPHPVAAARADKLLARL